MNDAPDWRGKTILEIDAVNQLREIDARNEGHQCLMAVLGPDMVRRLRRRKGCRPRFVFGKKKG